MVGCQVGLKEFEPDVYGWPPELLVTDLTCEACNEPLIRRNSIFDEVEDTDTTPRSACRFRAQPLKWAFTS
jgi:hypothetical protein